MEDDKSFVIDDATKTALEQEVAETLHQVRHNWDKVHINQGLLDVLYKKVSDLEITWSGMADAIDITKGPPEWLTKLLEQISDEIAGQQEIEKFPAEYMEPRMIMEVIRDIEEDFHGHLRNDLLSSMDRDLGSDEQRINNVIKQAKKLRLMSLVDSVIERYLGSSIARAKNLLARIQKARGNVRPTQNEASSFDVLFGCAVNSDNEKLLNQVRDERLHCLDSFNVRSKKPVDPIMNNNLPRDPFPASFVVDTDNEYSDDNIAVLNRTRQERTHNPFGDFNNSPDEISRPKAIKRGLESYLPTIDDQVETLEHEVMQVMEQNKKHAVHMKQMEDKFTTDVMATLTNIQKELATRSELLEQQGKLINDILKTQEAASSPKPSSPQPATTEGPDVVNELLKTFLGVVPEATKGLPIEAMTHNIMQNLMKSVGAPTPAPPQEVSPPPTTRAPEPVSPLADSENRMCEEAFAQCPPDWAKPASWNVPIAKITTHVQRPSLPDLCPLKNLVDQFAGSSMSALPQVSTVLLAVMFFVKIGLEPMLSRYGDLILDFCGADYKTKEFWQKVVDRSNTQQPPASGTTSNDTKTNNKEKSKKSKKNRGGVKIVIV